MNVFTKALAHAHIGNLPCWSWDVFRGESVWPNGFCHLKPNHNLVFLSTGSFSDTSFTSALSYSSLIVCSLLFFLPIATHCSFICYPYVIFFFMIFTTGSIESILCAECMSFSCFRCVFFSSSLLLASERDNTWM